MQLIPSMIYYGSDPELFLQRGGIIIGSERVIPKEGVKISEYANWVKIVRDGIQIELHPAPKFHTADVGSEMSNVMWQLRNYLKKYPDVSISYKTVIEMDTAELLTLDPENRVLGCQPSFNIWNLPKMEPPEGYTIRSAGGHLHFGIEGLTSIMSQDKVTDYRMELIPLLDFFVGNTAVMIDMDKRASERRQMYGRAGEYRLPSYGVEYRTMSNFWLKAGFTTMDLLMGMGNFAISVLKAIKEGHSEIEQKLMDAIDATRMIAAIQRNDQTLARQNFDDIRDFIAEYASDRFPLYKGNIDDFCHWSRAIEEHGGLDYFFNNDPAESWITGRRARFVDFIHQKR